METMNNHKIRTFVSVGRLITIVILGIGVFCFAVNFNFSLGYTYKGYESQGIVSAAFQKQQNFEAEPPIARQIFVEKLSRPDGNGNTILLSVQFLPTENRLKSTSRFTLVLGENREVVFTDLGINGDKKSGDGIFSAPLRVSDEEFLNLVNRNNEIVRSKDGLETVFIARSATIRRLSLFDIAGFRAGRIVPLDLAFTSIVDSNSIRKIRDQSLMVRDVSVVEDLSRTYDPCRSPKGNPAGAWAFKTLMDNLANTPVTGVSTKEFVIDWVDNFLFNPRNHPTSGDAAANRLLSKERLIKAWMKNSGVPVPVSAGIPLNWQQSPLKVEDFPVRLLAIVNRLDLRGNSGYGTFSNPGEGRFVFSFVDSNRDCTNGNNGPGTMTFILEYAIPISNCIDLKNYAMRWWDMRGKSFGGVFNSDLQAITNVFTAANAMPSKPNRSALNHLRTNDFLSSPWDIRDFEIDASTRKLKLVHPSKEPMESSNGFFSATIMNVVKNSKLVSFVNGLSFSAGNPTYTIPADIAGNHAPMKLPDLHWRGSSNNFMNPLNRREFSFNTCSGCHTRETQNPFTHVRPRTINTAADLSGFMTGMGVDDNPNDGPDNDPMGRFFVKDPVVPLATPKQFNEALDRAISLETLIFNSPCFSRPRFAQDVLAIHQILKFSPKNMEH